MNWLMVIPFILLTVGTNLIAKGFIRGFMTRWFAVFVLVLIYTSIWGEYASTASNGTAIVMVMFWQYVIAIGVFVFGMFSRLFR
jgi:hypothetical protein